MEFVAAFVSASVSAQPEPGSALVLVSAQPESVSAQPEPVLEPESVLEVQQSELSALSLSESSLFA